MGIKFIQASGATVDPANPGDYSPFQPAQAGQATRITPITDLNPTATIPPPSFEKSDFSGIEMAGVVDVNEPLSKSDVDLFNPFADGMINPHGSTLAKAEAEDEDHEQTEAEIIEEEEKEEEKREKEIAEESGEEPEDEGEDAAKSMLAAYVAKGGPIFYGPQGGEYEDWQHKIPHKKGGGSTHQGAKQAPAEAPRYSGMQEVFNTETLEAGEADEDILTAHEKGTEITWQPKSRYVLNEETDKEVWVENEAKVVKLGEPRTSKKDSWEMQLTDVNGAIEHSWVTSSEAVEEYLLYEAKNDEYDLHTSNPKFISPESSKTKKSLEPLAGYVQKFEKSSAPELSGVGTEMDRQDLLTSSGADDLFDYLTKGGGAHKYIKRMGPFFDKHGRRSYRYIYPEDLKKKPTVPLTDSKKKKYVKITFAEGEIIEVQSKSGKKASRHIATVHDDDTVTLRRVQDGKTFDTRVSVDVVHEYMHGEPVSAEEIKQWELETAHSVFGGSGLLESQSGAEGGSGPADEAAAHGAPTGNPGEETGIGQVEQWSMPPSPYPDLPDGVEWEPTESPAIQAHEMLLPETEYELPENIKVFPGSIPGKPFIKQLYSHQVEGAERILTAWAEQDGMVLMDDAGLGKTNTALAAMVGRGGSLPDKRNLIVVPASGKAGLKAQWTETAKLYNIDLQGKTDLEPDNNGTFIVSYDEFWETKKYTDHATGKVHEIPVIRPQYKGKKFDTVLFDECHTMQNATRKTGRMGVEIQKYCDKALYMSATPYTTISDMHYLTKLGEFKDRDEFKLWAAKAGATVKSNVVLNPSNPLLPMAAVAATFHVDGKALKRSTSLEGMESKFDMMGQEDLEPVQHTTINTCHDIMHMTTEAGLLQKSICRALYTNWSRQYWETIKVKKAIELGKKAISEGKQVAFYTSFKTAEHAHIKAFPKMLMRKAERESAKGNGFVAEQCVQLAENIEEAIEHGMPSPPNPTEALRDAFGGADAVSEIHGNTNKKPYDEMMAYQSGAKKVVVATMAKGGTGISLHDTEGNAPRMQINLSLPWSGREFDQVAGRSYRLGSKSEAEMFWLVGDDPNEQRNAAKVAARLQTLGSLTSGNPEATLDATALSQWADGSLSTLATDDDPDKLIAACEEIQEAADSGEKPTSDAAEEVRDYFLEYAQKRKGGANVIHEMWEQKQIKKAKHAFLEGRRVIEQIRSLHTEPGSSFDSGFDMATGKFYLQGPWVQKNKAKFTGKKIGGDWNKYRKRIEISPTAGPTQAGMLALAKKLDVHKVKVDMSKIPNPLDAKGVEMLNSFRAEVVPWPKEEGLYRIKHKHHSQPLPQHVKDHILANGGKIVHGKIGPMILIHEKDLAKIKAKDVAPGLLGKEEAGAKKSMVTQILEDYLSKAGGPFIGPRGGKWADAKHTIPWQEGKTASQQHQNAHADGSVGAFNRAHKDTTIEQHQDLAKRHESLASATEGKHKKEYHTAMQEAHTRLVHEVPGGVEDSVETANTAHFWATGGKDDHSGAMTTHQDAKFKYDDASKRVSRLKTTRVGEQGIHQDRAVAMAKYHTSMRRAHLQATQSIQTDSTIKLPEKVLAQAKRGATTHLEQAANHRADAEKFTEELARWDAKKSMHPASEILEDYLAKAGGPFIGPKGGKWADAKHTIPWKEGKSASEQRKNAHADGSAKAWLNDHAGSTGDHHQALQDRHNNLASEALSAQDNAKHESNEWFKHKDNKDYHRAMADAHGSAKVGKLYSHAHGKPWGPGGSLDSHDTSKVKDALQQAHKTHISYKDSVETDKTSHHQLSDTILTAAKKHGLHHKDHGGGMHTLYSPSTYSGRNITISHENDAFGLNLGHGEDETQHGSKSYGEVDSDTSHSLVAKKVNAYINEHASFVHGKHEAGAKKSMNSATQILDNHLTAEAAAELSKGTNCFDEQLADEALSKSDYDLIKAGPYIGPRGGKWADPQFKIPWKEDKHGGKAAPTAKGHDAHGARELSVHIDNEEEFVNEKRSNGVPTQRGSIHANLAKKIAAGKYDHAQAGKLFGHLADAASKHYGKKYGGPAGGGHHFDPATRAHAAREMADQFHDDVKAGHHDHHVSSGVHAKRAKAGGGLGAMAEAHHPKGETKSGGDSKAQDRGHTTEFGKKIDIQHTEIPGEAPHQVGVSGDQYYVLGPSGRKKKIGKVGGPQGRGRGTNYRDKAVAHAKTMNEKHAAKANKSMTGGSEMGELNKAQGMPTGAVKTLEQKAGVEVKAGCPEDGGKLYGVGMTSGKKDGTSEGFGSGLTPNEQHLSKDEMKSLEAILRGVTKSDAMEGEVGLGHERDMHAKNILAKSLSNPRPQEMVLDGMELPEGVYKSMTDVPEFVDSSTTWTTGDGSAVTGNDSLDCYIEKSLEGQSDLYFAPREGTSEYRLHDDLRKGNGFVDDVKGSVDGDGIPEHERGKKSKEKKKEEPEENNPYKE